MGGLCPADLGDRLFINGADSIGASGLKLAVEDKLGSGFRIQRPVSEALRLWWDLVSSWPGEPDTMPHRFLQLTGENHWVLSPANAEIWYDALLGFCGQHVLGAEWTPSPLL